MLLTAAGLVRSLESRPRRRISNQVYQLCRRFSSLTRRVLLVNTERVWSGLVANPAGAASAGGPLFIKSLLIPRSDQEREPRDDRR